MPKKNLYSATKSLEMKYTFNLEYEQNEIVVPAIKQHALLFAGVDGLLGKTDETYNFDKEGSKGTKKKTIDQANFATAAFTALYTDSTSEEGTLGEDIEQKSFYVNVPATTPVFTSRILSSKDFYVDVDYSIPRIAKNKRRRDRKFNELLKQRVTAFSGVADEFTFSKGTIASPKALATSIDNPMFHETFHHSEQAMMHFLSSKEGLTLIAQALSTCKDIGYLYGIVLDIYTQRVLCCNCNASLIGLQHSQKTGFLADLSATIAGEDYRIESRENLMLSTRVSASQGVTALRLATDKKDVVHMYDPDVKNLIYQAENKALGTRRIIDKYDYSLATFRGAFFTSREIPGKIRLEKQINIEHKHPEPVGFGKG